jgi:Tfp pilus assembly protein PilF
VRSKSGDRTGAREASEEAARLRLGSSKLALGVAEMAEKHGDRSAARRWVALALERDPNNPEALEQAAQLLRTLDGEDAGDVARADQLALQVQRLRERYGAS